LKVWPPSP